MVLLKTLSEELSLEVGHVPLTMGGICSSRHTCQTTEIAGLPPFHYYHRYLTFFKGQSQNKWSASQGSDTSLYRRRWRPLWYLVVVTWVIFLSDSINQARLLPPSVFSQLFFFFFILSPLLPHPNDSYLDMCWLPFLFIFYFLEFKQ